VAPCHGLATAAPRTLRGVELRYALTLYLAQHGPHTVAELIVALTYQGFQFTGRPSKAVSDALRWEIRYDSVRDGPYWSGD